MRWAGYNYRRLFLLTSRATDISSRRNFIMKSVTLKCHWIHNRDIVLLIKRVLIVAVELVTCFLMTLSTATMIYCRWQRNKSSSWSTSGNAVLEVKILSVPPCFNQILHGLLWYPAETWAGECQSIRTQIQTIWIRLKSKLKDPARTRELPAPLSQIAGSWKETKHIYLVSRY